MWSLNFKVRMSFAVYDNEEAKKMFEFREAEGSWK
jgi:hypothetical protein